MKLSFREKIILMVVVAILTLVLGFVLVIKPQFANISSNKANLTTVQAQKADIEAKIQSAAQLNDKLKAIYDEDKKLSEFFLPEVNTYEVDKYVYDIAKQSNLVIESLSLTPMKASDVVFYAPKVETVQYPLQASANLSDGTQAAQTTVAADPNQPAAVEQAGLSIATITFSATSDAQFKAFLDAIDKLDKSVIITSCTSKAGETGGITGTIAVNLYSIKTIPEITLK